MLSDIVSRSWQICLSSATERPDESKFPQAQVQHRAPKTEKKGAGEKITGAMELLIPVYLRRRRNEAPASPSPSRVRLAGSGVVVGGGGGERSMPMEVRPRFFPLLLARVL
jgi:hypothetical protein